jgi:threonine/homoserine/homoserine lactone efflux protein
MEASVALSFLSASVLLTLMPGPDNLYVLTESATKGSRHGLAISLGLCSGILVHTTAAATGLSLILQQSATAYTILKYLGAAYLLYLAYQSWLDKDPAVRPKAVLHPSREHTWALIRKGFLMNVLNPKVSLFFIAFLPQFVRATGRAATVEMLWLGMLFMAQALLIFGLLSVLSGRLTRTLQRPGFWTVSRWIKTGVLAVLGVALAVSRH